jgi:hypothetical protein
VFDVVSVASHNPYPYGSGMRIYCSIFLEVRSSHGGLERDPEMMLSSCLSTVTGGIWLLRPCFHCCRKVY